MANIGPTKNMLPFLLLLLAYPFSSSAQKEEIKLQNPSFEDFNKIGSPPAGWRDCGFTGETPPDVNPHPEFYVTRPAQNGNTYLGMVTRDNDTWEGVGQRLEKPLQPGKCYAFSIWLCRSDTYRSPTKTTRQVEFFTQPVKVVFWGGNSDCDKAEKLGETAVVSNTDWKKYDLKFKPTRSLQYFFIETYYQTPVLFAYNGNVLVDNASSLVVISCDTNEPVAANDNRPGDRVNTPPAKTPPAPKPVEPAKPEPGKPEPTPPAPGPVTFNETLKGADMQVGQTFQMANLYFPADSATPRPISFKELDKLYDFLVANPKISIEVGGHTNNVPKDAFCDDLSTRRAKSVADYLIKKGISADRIKYKGYGKRNPIADNSTEAGRKKNQRVEIKILKVD